MIEYQLQYWNKETRKYITVWTGQRLEIAQRLAKKPYYNYPYMGKKRILSISIQIIGVSK